MIEIRPPRIARISALSLGNFAMSTTLPSSRGSANSTSPAVIIPLRGRMRRMV
jgi:hypothetical protein